MDNKKFMVNLYDLLANNTEYHPREKLDSIIAENIEDYYVDSTNYNPPYTADDTHIMFTCLNGKQYKLELVEMEGE